MRSFILKRPIIFFLLLNFIFLLLAIFTIKNDMYYLFPYWVFAGILNRKLLNYCNSDRTNNKLEAIVTWIVIFSIILALIYSFHDLNIKDEIIINRNV